jgi:UDP:flavonoid glycosyltransferase YjiC (YdhE family)
LQAGVPVLMLPMHAEQLLFARRVVRSGAGGYLMEADAGPKLLPTLQRLLQDPSLRACAQALAAVHSTARYGDVAQRVADRCEALAGGLPQPGAGDG